MGSLAGAPVFIVEADHAMANLLEAAVIAAGGVVAGLAFDYASTLDLIETLPVAAVLLALFTKGVRCDETAAELTRRSIPFVVTAGLDHHRQAQSPADIEHFQIAYIIERLGRLVSAQGRVGASAPSDEALQRSSSAKDDVRMAG